MAADRCPARPAFGMADDEATARADARSSSQARCHSRSSDDNETGVVRSLRVELFTTRVGGFLRCLSRPAIEKKNRPANGIRTTTSPLVVQNPTDWPVSSGNNSSCASHASGLCLRKGERGVVRGIPARPLAVNRSRSVKRLSPVGWILAKLVLLALSGSE